MCIRIALLMLMLSGVSHGVEMALEPDTGGSIAGYKDKGFTYGICITPPWENGGKYILNLPEHLDYREKNAAILHQHDKREKPAWVISADKKSATINVESPYTKGLWYAGEIKFGDANTVNIKLELQNKTDNAIKDIDALFCTHFRLLTGFPSWKKSLPQTLVPFKDKLVTLAELPTPTPDAIVKMANIKGSGVVKKSAFAENFGGVCAEPLDFPLVLVRSMDNKRKVAMQWTPPGMLLSNTDIPCMHCDPIFADVPPQGKSTVTGVIYFSEEADDVIYAKFKKLYEDSQKQPTAR